MNLGFFIKVTILAIVISLFIGCEKGSNDTESVSKQPDRVFNDAEIREAIEQSDDFEKHEVAFMTASRKLISEGRCTLAALKYNGGWIRSTNFPGGQIYFTYLRGRGATMKDKIYLDVRNGELFKDRLGAGR